MTSPDGPLTPEECDRLFGRGGAVPEACRERMIARFREGLKRIDVTEGDIDHLTDWLRVSGMYFTAKDFGAMFGLEMDEDLAVLAAELLGEFPAPVPADAERKIKGVIARIFRLGMSAGFEKAQQ